MAMKPRAMTKKKPAMARGGKATDKTKMARGGKATADKTKMARGGKATTKMMRGGMTAKKKK